MKTELLTEKEIEKAAEFLRQGGLVGIPTETVYGLGANGLNDAAVAAIFEAKGRPQDNPLILHVPSADWLEDYCRNIPESAYALARRFWPGPLTMVLYRKENVPDRVTAGLPTVGMRCPDHAICRAVIEAAGVPVAAPSGNTSGRPSPTTAQHMLEDMEGKIEAIVDGGPCTVGVESTIVDMTCQPPRLLRPGGLPLEDLQEVLGEIEVDPAVRRMMKEGETPRAPGMKYRHYAPKAPVTVVKGEPEATARYIKEQLGAGSGVICFDEYAGLFEGYAVETIGAVRDQAAQARRIFAALRAFDQADVHEIWAQCPEDTGLGLAVTNRLNKAAGFHIIDIIADKKEEPDSLKIKRIGITGPTGAGKTTALKALEALGVCILDADAVYYDLLAESGELKKALTDRYGEGILTVDGSVDRKKLGAIVFADPAALEDLNRITHHFVGEEVDRREAEAQKAGMTTVAIDAIALVESGLAGTCYKVVSVIAPAEVRIQRIMARDGISEEYARSRVNAQKSDEFYRAHSHHVLENDGSLSPEEFYRVAYEYFESIL